MGKELWLFLCTVVNSGPESFKVYSTKHDASLSAHISIILQGALAISDQAELAAECSETLDLSEALTHGLEKSVVKQNPHLLRNRHNKN